MASLGIGLSITAQRRRDVVAALAVRLFAAGESGAFFSARQSSLTQDATGTAPATPGDPVRLWRDLSPNGINATSGADDQTLEMDGPVPYVDHASGTLSVTLPDLGTGATLVTVTWEGVVYAEGQTISGATTLPQAELEAVIYIDRALTAGEKQDIEQALGGNVWLLASGEWDDSGRWRDIAEWRDN